MRQPRTRKELLEVIRQDRDFLAASLHELNGWMREARVKRIAELDTVLAKLTASDVVDPPEDPPADAG